MGTTRIIPMHQNKGKSILQSLTGRIDYVKDGDKTKEGELISASGCMVESADKQFALTKDLYRKNTGKKIKNDVIAYQVRQASSPDDTITPELANKIGYELAEKLTKGNHAFLVCTHVDKKHIHNHIIFNSTTQDCTRKFRNFWNSYKAVRSISDLLCLNHGLSIIENPKNQSKNYGEYSDRPPNFSDKLRTAIDETLAEKPKDFEGFLRKMASRGYLIKKGKHLAFKSAEQKKFTRLRSLGESYSEENIQKAITGEREHIPKTRKKKEDRVSLLLDLQSEVNQKKGAGYKRWATKFNTKQLARTMTYLAENKLTDYKDLSAKAEEVVGQFNQLTVEIKRAEKSLTEISLLQKMIVQYARTKDTYVAYRKSGYSPQFKEQNISDITLHQTAKKHFKELNLEQLPKMADLNTQYNEVKAKKKQLNSQQYELNEEKKEILNAKANVESLLDLKEDKEQEEKVKAKKRKTER